MVVDFRLEPIFNTAPDASKNNGCFKSGQNHHKNNHLTSLIYICDAFCTICIGFQVLVAPEDDFILIVVQNPPEAIKGEI